VKFLLHGNAPTVKTGYGVQIGQLAKSLQAAGHDVAVSSTYGVQGSIQSWNGIRIYPCGYDVNSNDLIHGHADHFFDDTPRDECWIITLIDVWAMTNPILSEYNVAAWVPIDHFPVPSSVREFFSRTQAVPVAMSRFGERNLYDCGLDPVYIPLSVDTDMYRPTETVGGVTGRELIDVPDEAFLVGMVAMNKGWSKDRKGFNEAFWAFGQFLKSHPEAVLYVHAEKLGGAEGQNLEQLRILAGIPDTNFRWVNQYAYRAGYPAEMMAAAYSSFDVLLAPSHGEGFCVPLIEAQACGTPVIATDFSAQSELIGSGWALKGQPEYDPPHQANYVTPFIGVPPCEHCGGTATFDVLGALNLAYAEKVADREGRTSDAVKFARDYDTKTVFEQYWVPFIDSLRTDVPVDGVREPMPDDMNCGRGHLPGARTGPTTLRRSSSRSSRTHRRVTRPSTSSTTVTTTKKRKRSRVTAATVGDSVIPILSRRAGRRSRRR
jgi:glycosyltransferase involved in cell wall biosynthesis